MQAFVILSKDGSFAVAISPETISLTIDGVHSFDSDRTKSTIAPSRKMKHPAVQS